MCKKTVSSEKNGENLSCIRLSEHRDTDLEFFDVFGKQVGTTPSRELYKFFDREGNTLVLRPDFTPSIARAASMYYHQEDMPIRLCYSGNTFVNRSSYQGRLKESTQMGVELLGDASVDGDGEIIAMTVELLKAAGLKEFQISIGQVDFFKALVDDSGMSEETIQELRQLISNKNYFGVEELLESQRLSKEQVEALTELPQLFGGPEVLKKAESLTGNPKALAAIRRYGNCIRWPPAMAVKNIFLSTLACSVNISIIQALSSRGLPMAPVSR